MSISVQMFTPHSGCVGTLHPKGSIGISLSLFSSFRSPPAEGVGWAWTLSPLLGVVVCSTPKVVATALRLVGGFQDCYSGGSMASVVYYSHHTIPSENRTNHPLQLARGRESHFRNLYFKIPRFRRLVLNLTITRVAIRIPPIGFIFVSLNYNPAIPTILYKASFRERNGFPVNVTLD